MELALERLDYIMDSYVTPDFVEVTGRRGDVITYRIYDDGSKFEMDFPHSCVLYIRLMTLLFAEGRTADAQLAAKDEEAREKLYREFGMID